MLDHDRFSQGYHNGRRYYFEDQSPEEQPPPVQIRVSNLLHLVAILDEQGRYQLEDGRDITAFKEGVEELVGVLIGYLGGPLCPETLEEQQKRQAECIVIHEAVPVR